MPIQTLFENHMPLHAATSGFFDSQAPQSDADVPHPPLAILLAGAGPHPIRFGREKSGEKWSEAGKRLGLQRMGQTNTRTGQAERRTTAK